VKLANMVPALATDASSFVGAVVAAVKAGSGPASGAATPPAFSSSHGVGQFRLNGSTVTKGKTDGSNTEAIVPDARSSGSRPEELVDMDFSCYWSARLHERHGST
jgi:hypothetical protein